MTMANQIENWITPNPAVVDAEELLVNAVQMMAERQIGAILVTQNDELSGIFTERDLLRLFSENTETAFKEHLLEPIKTFMTASPICAQSKDDYNTVYMKMKTHDVRHIPILEDKKLVGIVSMRDLIHHYQNKLETAYNEARQEIEDLKKLVSVAKSDKIETLIKEVQKYKELSLTDHLTGLFNKRYFQTRLVEEVTRARRSSYDISLIFCDIDYFKRVNDRFGHHIGDEVLRKAAQILRGGVDELNIISRLRKSDIIARYGGEEFVIIGQRARADGFAEVKPLERFTALGEKILQLVFCLHTLGDNIHQQAVTESYNRVDDLGIPLFRHVDDKGLVDLQNIHGEIGKVA